MTRYITPPHTLEYPYEVASILACNTLCKTDARSRNFMNLADPEVHAKNDIEKSLITISLISNVEII